MPSASFTFSASGAVAQRTLYHVNEMSGVNASLSGSGPYTIAAEVTEPFDSTRLDNVENIVSGLNAGVVRS